ncbi:glycosyl hydrolase [Arthrobacter sp. D2-10]
MSMENLKRELRIPGIEYRPEVRWWLAEGFHTTPTLRAEVAAAYELGFGGMEFLAMDVDGIDHARYGWGSEEWARTSQVVVEETTRRGMAVSFTSGTNWANANLPTINPEHPAASKELNVAVERISGGLSRSGPLRRVDPNKPMAPMVPPVERGPISDVTLVAVIAAPLVGSTERGVVLDAERIIDLTNLVRQECLDWTAPNSGEWQIFTYWIHGTGQTASPSASVNYAVNYLDPDGVEAVIDYWESSVLTPELRQQLDANPRTQMYMDSLELATFGAGGLLWGRTLCNEFAARRGYDVRPWLPFLTCTPQSLTGGTVFHNEPLPEQQVTVDKVRFDLVHTFTDLYIENMLRPLAHFLHEQGIELRAEISYGMPFELTRPGPEVDGIETESFEFGSQIDAYRLMAGPAHLFGKQYSSETGATTRNHMLDHRFYDQIIATQLAAGVTKTVLHGFASTAGAEGATHWPGHEGMWAMFSERFDTRQPSCEFYPLWASALGRYQLVLRRGKPRVDIGILRTDHFVDAHSGLVYRDDKGNRLLEEDSYGRRWMRDRQNHWWQDLGMQDAGWTYEFFDGELLLRKDVSFTDGLVQPEGPGYQALIVYQEALDPDVASQLLQWARDGLRVLIVNGARELKVLLTNEYVIHEQAAARTPGLDGRDAELASTLNELRGLPNVAEVAAPSSTLGALRDLGVRGRAEFLNENRNVLSHLREDGDLAHLYLYHFLYETGQPTTVEVALQGGGDVYRVDAWTGRVRPHAETKANGARTVITVTLHPGETALFTLDRSAPPVQRVASTKVETVASLLTWTTSVESWDAGESTEVHVEDRGLGYETREVRPTTEISRLEAGSGALRPWCDIPEVGPEVSGVGEYRATFTLSEAVAPSDRYVLDLGSTAGGLGSVHVNDGMVTGFDTSHPVVDVSADVRSGQNTVVIRVASSLNNRLIARGYYDSVLDLASLIGEHQPAPPPVGVRAHGLLGPVHLIRERG